MGNRQVKLNTFTLPVTDGHMWGEYSLSSRVVDTMAPFQIRLCDMQVGDLRRPI
jgi:hypothetical protein